MAEKKIEIFFPVGQILFNLTSTSWKKLYSCVFLRSLQITYLITLSLEKEIIVLEKVWKKSGILDEKYV